ncbi:MAG: chromosome partitioning protein ParB [Deltaproteobacteria bacterium]|nr:MAG: chromosome partitioning protein ParB [Deltaproteobacteria bacterium]
MRKRRPLGKGLEALIPSSRQATAGRVTEVYECSIDEIVPNSSQPRQAFDEEKLRDLTESVRNRGLIHPLIVRRLNGKYQIVAGERRWRAARLAGLKRVPVFVKDLTDSEVLELALIENLQREDLNPLEEAEAYRQLAREHGLSQAQIAQRVGRQRSSVTNSLRLLKLPERVKQALLAGTISMGHARAILALDSEAAQLKLAQRVVKEGLSVRECEQLAAGRKAGARRVRKRRAYSADERQLLDSLQRQLGTKVDLVHGRKGGRLIITYYSLEQLDEICQRLARR